MGRSQETFNKKEREKNKQKKRKEKESKRKERKTGEKNSADNMIAYVDEFGRITSTPPDPSKRQEVRSEDIQVNVPRREDTGPEPPRKGKVVFFNDSKGYGFIRDLETQESIFVHIKALGEPIGENDMVTFEVEMTPRGKSAVDVKKDV